MGRFQQQAVGNIEGTSEGARWAKFRERPLGAGVINLPCHARHYKKEAARRLLGEVIPATNKSDLWSCSCVLYGAGLCASMI